MAEIKKKVKCDADSISLLSAGVALSDVTEWIPTGFPALDEIFGGGWPVGRASEVAGNEGCGKCLADDTPVRMFDGSIRAVRDIKVGDFVMGDDSTPREVLETHKGTAELYRVRLRGGDYFDCTGNHRLCFRRYVQNKGSGGHFVHHEMELLEYLRQNAGFKRHSMAYRVPVDYAPKVVHVPPRFLGIWLGDGVSTSPRVCTADVEIVEELWDTACRFGLTVKLHYGADRAAPVYGLTSEKNCPNPLLDALRGLDVLGNKHIPEAYLRNTRSVRLELLAGLIDTDGSYDGHGFEYTSVREQLADDVKELARSLGIAANKHVKRVNGKDYFRVHMYGCGLSAVPCVLLRKRADKVGQRVNSLHSAMKIDPIGKGAYTGLVVDGNQRFVLGNYVVTHNSALAHMAIKQCQMLGGEPMIIDFEHSLDRKKMKQLEIDEDRLIYSDPQDVEEAWDAVWTALDYVEKHPPKAPFLIVWDSVAGTVARSERTEDSHADKHVASRAGAMDKGARKMYRRIAKVRAHMLWVNQERVVFGQKSFFQPKTTPGGAQLKFAASLRVGMWRSNIKYAVAGRDKEEVVGYKSFVKTNKCRLAPPHRSSYFVLDFLHGPSPEMTMFHHLIDGRKIKVSGGGTYTGAWSKKKFKRRDWLKMLRDQTFLTGALVAYAAVVATATKFTGSVEAAEGEKP